MVVVDVVAIKRWICYLLAKQRLDQALAGMPQISNRLATIFSELLLLHLGGEPMDYG